MVKKPVIVAVDGPAGSGKSSLCKLLARELGWSFVSTGSIYRAVGVCAKKDGISLQDEAALIAMANGLNKRMAWDHDRSKLLLDGQDISPELFTETAGPAASKVAKIPGIRSALLEIQRAFCFSTTKTGVVVEGRDIGTVVFPDADMKVFLTASLEERTRRRLQQMARSKSDLDEKVIQKDIADRDLQDASREVAPMQKASDAVEFDTSHLNLEESVQAIIGMLKARKILH